MHEENSLPLLAVLFLGACSSVPQVDSVELPAAKTDVGHKLRAELAQLMKELPQMESQWIQLDDYENGIGFDSRLGEISLDVGVINQSTGFVTFKNGSSLRISSGDKSFVAQSSIGPLALCQPYKQLKTNTGFSAARAVITVPGSGDVTGIDADKEANYNYLGLYFSGAYESGGYSEAGLFTARDSTYYTPNVWYAYTAGGKYYTSTGVARIGVVAHREFAYGLPEGVSPSTSVRVQTSLLATRTFDDGLNWYVSSVFSIPNTTYSKTFIRRDFSTPGSFTNFRAGRTTSYLSNTINYFDGTRNNRWSSVSVGSYTVTDPMSSDGYYTYQDWTPQLTASGYPRFGNDGTNCLTGFSVNSIGDGYTTDNVSITYP